MSYSGLIQDIYWWYYYYSSLGVIYTCNCFIKMLQALKMNILRCCYSDKKVQTCVCVYLHNHHPIVSDEPLNTENSE